MYEFFANILRGLYSFIGNYGVCMIIFTLLVKLIVLPLDYKSRKGMRRMTSMQPQLQKLQKKYANDKEKLNQKTAELYRSAGVSPMSGCLPMLVSMVILWIMWGSMRLVANTELVRQSLQLLITGEQVNESFLWIRNIWVADSPFHPMIAISSDFQQIPADIWTSVFASLSEAEVAALAPMGIAADTINGTTVSAALSQLPLYTAETALNATLPYINLLITKLYIYANNNGWFVLPIAAAVSQFLMTATQPQQPAAEGANAGGMNGFMKYFFPLFSLWLCSSYSAMFALYWVVSNLFAWAEQIIFNKIFEAEDAKNAVTESVGEVSLK